MSVSQQLNLRVQHRQQAQAEELSFYSDCAGLISHVCIFCVAQLEVTAETLGGGGSVGGGRAWRRIYGAHHQPASQLLFGQLVCSFYYTKSHSRKQGANEQEGSEQRLHPHRSADRARQRPSKTHFSYPRDTKRCRSGVERCWVQRLRRMAPSQVGQLVSPGLSSIDFRSSPYYLEFINRGHDERARARHRIEGGDEPVRTRGASYESSDRAGCLAPACFRWEKSTLVEHPLRGAADAAKRVYITIRVDGGTVECAAALAPAYIPTASCPYPPAIACRRRSADGDTPRQQLLSGR